MIVLVAGLAAALCIPAFGVVQITSMTPSVPSPQLIGTAISWTVTGTDSSPNMLTFQFRVGPPTGKPTVVKDFNIGTSSSGTWTAQPFVWVPTGIEGIYTIQVVAKDFVTGEKATRTVVYTINPLVTGSMPVVAATPNPLVALFSAPSCAAGSVMRVAFQEKSASKPSNPTNYVSCHPPYTMTFEVAGMYPSTTYNLFAQTRTGGTITNGPMVKFTTGSVPSNVPLPPFQVIVPAGKQTDLLDALLLLGPAQFGGGPQFATVAADLSGKILWYYNPSQSILLTRPLPGGTLLTFQSGAAWNPKVTELQYLRQIDLAGNIVKETNTGAIQQEMLALGAIDGGPCTAVPKPAPVGAACLDGFTHDAIQTLPNGETAVLMSMEKVFPPGTQGDTSGLPVDIIGEMILVLDANWQVIWYFEAFQHDGGAPQLDINRAAVLGETCSQNQNGCPGLSLLGPSIATEAKDWLHGNSLYYWPKNGDLIWSSRHQDWVMKIDYNNGAGSGNILWRMGPCGDFTFSNIYGDGWPWNSHQHDAGMENSGAGPLTLFDNGNTRVSPPSGPGSSTGCMPGVGSGNSRGMSLTVDEGNLQVMPVLSADLGVFSTADGSAQLLYNGNYFFVPAVVLVNLTTEASYSIEILPTTGTDTGKQVLNVAGTDVYRAWQIPNLYTPPTT